MATDTVRRIFDDLLNLEVNLILKADMTARKMPLTGEAFHDVATQYHRYLAKTSDSLGTSLTTNLVDENCVDSALFDGLVEDAKTLRRENDEVRSPSDEYGDVTEVVLKRIQRNSEQLAGIIRRNDLALKKDNFGEWTKLAIKRKEDLLILRKAWEVSTENVVMQTVAQVDGDIVTRIKPSYAVPTNNAQYVVHMNMVSTALEHWRFLFATIATFTLGAFRDFFSS